MKPNLPPRDDHAARKQSETSPAGAATATRLTPSDSQESGAPASPSTARPQLLRSPLARVSNAAHEEDVRATTKTPRTAAAAADPAPPILSYDPEHPSLTRAETTTSSDGTAKGKSPGPSPDEETLAKLKDAVSAKVLLQQKMRTSYDNNNRPPRLRDNPEAARPLSTVSNTSAVTSASTASTESAKTIRGSVPPTPSAAHQPLRTPSYPFPYVPGTPRTWSSSFHQPFTALSPTVSSHMGTERPTPGADSTGLASGGSTPAAAPAMFAPPGSRGPGPEDPRFPTPNLYNLVLQLGAEPGLDAWWAAVANIMHDHFKADRVTLAMPADPTDIENVPWGQKATFSMGGQEEYLSQSSDKSSASQGERPQFTLREPSGEAMSDVRPKKLHPERLRPRLDSRHSYAGQGRTWNDPTVEAARASGRPAGPQRSFTTYMPGSTPDPRGTILPPTRMPSASSVRTGSLADLEFSTDAGGVEEGPYAAVFPVLRALDHESHPLVEPGGISRVLERGRVVTVTRDYVPDHDVQQKSSTAATPNETAPTSTSQDRRPNQTFGNYRQMLAVHSGSETQREYDEYEQHPASPWTQSPAPSPAIQSDEDQNPFFANEEQQVEDSFNPVVSPQDYTQFGQVEAIGVDHASTVLHVPLVHPLLSQPMQSLRFSGSRTSESSQSGESIGVNRKAPIAILSILGTPVPYPSNLVQCLQNLGPHLATSLSNAQAFSAGTASAISIRHRRSASGRNILVTPMTIEPATLDEIVNADLEDPASSIPDNMTSPSDYSGRSRHSPGSSISGTPGWDPATHGWTSSRSVGGTPGVTGTEKVDNYFDAKKRNGHRANSGAGASAQTTPIRASHKKAPGQDGKSQADPEPPRSERKARFDAPTMDLKSPRRPIEREKGFGKFKDAPTSPHRPDLRHAVSQVPGPNDKHHSYLHSYGADFQSSFSALSAVTPGGEPKIPSPLGHTRKTSFPEEMPPPSERLLRTIIDSLPVQIFTAEPQTGKLTWVNAKFLIYRGQDSRQVLSEPWQAIHPDDRSEYMDTWNRSLRTGQQLQQKVRLQRFDGKYRWFYVRAAPLKDKRQNIVHWIGTNMDFHEQHVAELNLARQQETAASEAKYRALANSSPQIVFAVGRTKGVTFCNSQWMGYSGQTEGQALGVGFMDHVHPDDLAKCRLPTFEDGSNQPTNVPTSMPAELRRSKSMSVESSSGSSDTDLGSIQENSPPPQQPPQRKLSELATTGILKVARDADGRPSYSTEVRLRSKDGEFRWHLVRILLAEPLLQAGNEEETWYGTCTDINDHKTLERDLKETMDEKSRFLSNMSHEIRTPLNGITGMVNFLIDSNLSAEQMEHVSIIRASTEGLRGLINDILDLSKAEAGMIQLNMDWMYVRSLIEEVNDLTSTMAIDKGLELNYIVDQDVPAQFKGDRFRLRQILLNVVGNAIKFTQDGEVFVHCSVQQDEDHELAKSEMFVKFQVTDTGRGFTDKEAAALFKRFSQIDGSSTRQHGGTGLGLVISRQLAHLHGGDMSATGVPNKGSTFTFFVKTTLPSRDDQPPPPPPTPMAPSIPIFPMVASIASTPSGTPELGPTPGHKLMKVPSIQSVTEPQPKSASKIGSAKAFPPSVNSPDNAKGSPTVSSAGSEISAAARSNSTRSEHSSASSYVPDPAVPATTSMKLNMPSPLSPGSRDSGPDSNDSSATVKPTPGLNPAVPPPTDSSPPPMYSILVVSPLRYSRQATVQHIEKTLPDNAPHQITSKDNLKDCQAMLRGGDPVVFSHVVMVLKEVSDIIALMDQLLSSSRHSATTIVVITDLAQKRKIMEQAKGHDYKSLEAQNRVLFIFKPLKPSRFAVIFDPQKGRETSMDRNQDSAQQVAQNQKQVFAELSARLGKKDKRVLLVEDNKVNQMVILKFFSKVGIPVETVMDGVQCTEKVFAKPHGYYALILVSFATSNQHRPTC